MSIIHKKKKFRLELKKVNIFDFFVVAIIIFFVCIYVFNRFSSKATWVQTTIDVSDPELWWGGEPLQYWLLTDLQPGDKAFNTLGEEVAEVTDVNSFSIGGTNKKAFVTVNLKLLYNSTKKTYVYNFQPIYKGKTIELTFGSSNVSGIVTEIGSEKDVFVQKRIKLKVMGVEDWLANSYKKDMKMESSNGTTIAKINDISIINSPVKRVTLKNNSNLLMDTETLKDVYIDLSILTKKEDEYYRFLDGTQIQIGNKIWLQFLDISLENAQIVEIIE